MKEEQKRTFIGIDISKLTLDIFIRPYSGQPSSLTIANEETAIRKWIKSLLKDGCSSAGDQALFIGMENTGRYNWALYEVLGDMDNTVFVLNPLALSKSLGLTRGKNDQIDAKRICDYIEDHYQKLRQWKKPVEAITNLKVLLSERAARVKSSQALKTQMQDYKNMKNKALAKKLTRLGEQQLKGLQKQIGELEALIEETIESDDQLKDQSALMQSVPGVGKVLCWNMIIKTEGFSMLTDPRSLACYAGVAPFAHSSGTSVRGRTRVSLYADKTLKKLLHMSALSVIRLKGELRDYYLRKVAEGKNKMSVLNAIRNKIIHRICATIKNQQPYKPYKLNLAMS